MRRGVEWTLREKMDDRHINCRSSDIQVAKGRRHSLRGKGQPAAEPGGICGPPWAYNACAGHPASSVTPIRTTSTRAMQQSELPWQHTCCGMAFMLPVMTP